MIAYIEGKTRAEALAICEDERAIVSQMLEEIQHSARKRARLVNPDLADYSGDLRCLCHALDEQNHCEFAMLSDGHTKRLIEEALKQYHRNDPRS